MRRGGSGEWKRRLRRMSGRAAREVRRWAPTVCAVFGTAVAATQLLDWLKH